MDTSTPTRSSRPTRLVEVFLAFLHLGLTSFGGPVAHIGYFREEFVVRRRWLADQAFADLVALCQFLPGPASSQVGIALGLSRGGIGGALLAWLAFTLPSAVLLVLFATALSTWGDGAAGPWLHGLKVAAVAVVAQALWGMGRTLCADRSRITMAVLAAAAASLLPGFAGQISVIVAGALAGWWWLPAGAELPHSPLSVPITRRTGIVLLGCCGTLLLVLPLLATGGPYPLQLVDGLFRAGALVFGGGHVVLPLLQSGMVSTGWVSTADFLAGYGAAQAVPGPLFTFAAYLGAVADGTPNGVAGAALALAAIFLPAFLLVLGALPLWEGLRAHPPMRRAMQGINAAVVGLLLAAFYDPVWTNAIHSAADFLLAAAAFVALVFWRVPPWIVVALCALTTGLRQ